MSSKNLDREPYRERLRAGLGPRYEWTAETACLGQDLRGKVIVVTGANSGIGLETARALGKHGCRVIATVRAPGKGAELEQMEGVEVMELELCSLRSVDRFVAELKQKGVKIDAFINNAGTMGNPFKLTEDGFEMQIQVNYLAVAVLLSSVLKSGLMTSNGRIVVVSSAAHLLGKVPLGDINWRSAENYRKNKQYRIAKGCVILYANWLAHTLRSLGKSVTVNSVHPGVILTNLSRDLKLPSSVAKGHPAFKTWTEGAATQVWAAVSPELEGRTALYLENCQVTEIGSHVSPASGDPLWLSRGVNPYIWDPSRQVQLVAATERLLGRDLHPGLTSRI